MTSQRNKVNTNTLTIIVEIEEYARYLGMDPVVDRDLLWIPEEGVTPACDEVVEGAFARGVGGRTDFEQ